MLPGDCPRFSLSSFQKLVVVYEIPPKIISNKNPLPVDVGLQFLNEINDEVGSKRYRIFFE